MADLTPPNDPGHWTEILANDWRVRISELNNLAIKSLTTQVAVHGLTPMEFDLLRVCDALDRECTATELVRFLPVDPARISRLVNTLVDAGLLIRRRTLEDRRIVMLRLSEKGRDLTSRIMEDITQYNAGLIEGIGPDELQVFLQVTSRIIANLEALAEPE
ncbi:MAG: MarR family transcriptional regulator [Chloroflexi bacterium]|nr:MarR family transcriptional regulator [Chloroflexota bacterium]